MEKPIIEGTFLLKKGEEKGAWTFLELPVLENVPKKRNGTLRVKGRIDQYELKDFNLWAMKKGSFLSIKADIRKALKKEAGETVEVVLYLDELIPAVSQDDLMLCLGEEPRLLALFQKLSAKKRKEITDWVFAASVDDDKVARIGKVMERLESGAELKF